MCGIAGVYCSGGVDAKMVEAMTTAVSHRGPDAQGVYVKDVFGMGHTRLSIIDLSSGANQPFHSTDARYVMVFNGEIYNFQQVRAALLAERSITFRTHSDTEVVLEAFIQWGVKMVDRLEGMFAIGIADQQERKLYLFRDRAGKKPLYYYQSDTLFAFASEIKALLRHPEVRQRKRVNRSVIGSFLHLGYIPEPHTIYENVYKFPAGSWGVVSAGTRLQTNAYWRVTDHLEPTGATDSKQAIDELERLLGDAVQRRLVSDVPLGAFLSGGTDSSLVTALASRYVSTPLRTFSIGFSESKFDESRYARDVAKHLGTDHTAYVLSEREAVDLLETYLKHFDEPFADTSAIPTMLVSQLARRDVTVALTGDGGDELFQGYGSYTWANRLNRGFWKTFRGPLRTALMLSGKSRWERVAQLLKPVNAGGLRSHIFSQEQYFFDQGEIRDTILKDPADFAAFEYADPTAASRLTAGEKQALFDFQYYLKDDLLVKVDRASMHCALECRSPLLDYRVVEYAFSLDYTLKVREGQSKWILKQLLRRYLPDELIYRPKWGFSVPLANWLRGDLKYLVDTYLSDEMITEAGLFRPDTVRKLRNDFFNGKDYLYNRLWVIIVLQKWWKENNG